MELPEFPLLGLLILLWVAQRQVLSQDMRCDGFEITHYLLQQHHCKMTHTRSSQHLTIGSLYVEKMLENISIKSFKCLRCYILLLRVMHFDLV